jgi:predicted ATPase
MYLIELIIQNMSLKFRINNLGPIRDSEIEMKPLMVFSGDSSTGKSYLAFLNYYFFNIVLTEDGLKKHLDQKYESEIQLIKKRESHSFKFDIDSFKRWFNYEVSVFVGYLTDNKGFDCDVEIQFDLNDINVAIIFEDKQESLNKDEKRLNFSSFRIKVDDVELPLPENLLSSVDIIIGLLISQVIVSKIISNDKLSKAAFLPPARAALVGFNFSEKVAASSAGMYKEFLADMDDFISPASSEYHPTKQILQELNDIFSGDISHKEGRLYFHSKNVTIPITAAASSIKELAPLFMMLKKYSPDKLSVLFEEPEAHLHPLLQQKIADLISYLVGKGSYMQITTHSDYFLNRLNTLIRLYRLRKNDGFNEMLIETGINKDILLNPDKIGAYFFKKNIDGTVNVLNENLDDGVPFSSFDNAIKAMVRNTDIIEDYLEA